MRWSLLTLGAVALLGGACGGGATPTGPSAAASLPFVRETVTMRVYHEAGDTVDVDWQETFNAWAIAQLGIQPPKVEYRKYQSRDSMGRYTGRFNTNGFAEPDQWRLHTIWTRDNHEIVHLYSAPIGRPSDFFNEGFAVALQTDPAAGRLDAWFNGLEVHAACREYLRDGRLPQPLADYVTTAAFRALPDQVLSYRYSGSFVRFLMDRHGLAAVLEFMRRSSGRDESLAAIRARAQAVFGRALADLEDDWLTSLRR
ncbi:MAG: hypothetical protein AB7U83_22955 [Vicinamibacterales bacterium]